MSGDNEVVYSYTAESDGIMESLAAISEGIQAVLEDISTLIEAASELSALDEAFMGVAESLGGVDAVASETVAAIEEVTGSADAAAVSLGEMASASEGLGSVGAVAADAATEIDVLQGAIDSLGGALAEDTAMINGLNETIVNLQAQIDMLTVSEGAAEASAGGLAAMLAGVGATVTSVGEALQAAQGPLMLLGMGGIMAGKSFVDMGMKSEDALNQVQALAGVGASDMATYTTQLEAQATQFGESLDQEAQGLFYVTSAGFQNADAMKVMAQAVEDAKAGHVDLAVSTRALDSSLNAYGASADQATQYNDIMMTAVTKGVQTFGDFAGAISKAAIAGHAAHISFDQVAAAESELTTVGMTARNASMDLSSMMKALDSNIDATATTAKKLGLHFDEAKFKTMDLFHQMLYLQGITKGNQTELNKLVGGQTGLQAFNGLMTKNADGTYKFAQSLENMKNSTGAAAQAFQTSQDTISSHMEKINAAFSVISYKALEALTPTINMVANAVGKAADFMSQHMDIVMPILAGLAAFFGVIIVSAIAAFVASVWTVISPFVAVAAIIGAVVAAIIYAIENWGNIVGWLKGVWAGTPGFFSNLWQNIQGGVSGVGKWFGDKWNDAAKNVVSSLDWLYSHNYYFKNLTDAAKTATADATNFLKEAWKTVSTDAVNAWNVLAGKAGQLWNEISAPFRNAWNQYIAPPLNSLWNNIKGLWSEFVTNAGNLGKNLVQGIAGGISSKAGEAGQAARNIGERIVTLLGFHDAISAAQKTGGDIVTVVRSMGTNMVSAAQQGGANLISWWNGVVSSFAKSPIGGAIIKSLQDGLGGLGQQFSQIGQTMRTQLGDAISGVKPALDNLGKSFGVIWGQVSQLGQQIGGTFASSWKILQGTFEALAPVFSQLGQMIGGTFLSSWKILQGTFEALAPVFAQLGQQIGGTFAASWKLLQGAMSALAPVFAQIGAILGGQFMNTLKVLGAIIGGLILIVIAGLLGAIVGLARGLATFIAGIAKIITGFIQIWSGLFQIVSGIVALIVDLCTGNFGKLGADLGVIWQGIVTMFSGVWNVIQGIFQAVIGTVVSYIQGFVSTVIGFFTNLYNSLVGHSIIPDMINGIIKWFEQLPGRALGFIENLISGITTNLSGLGAKALTWAGDMISNFVTGIENGVGAVGNAVQKIASKIASFIHFSKPDVGPLADADLWMPDFMNLLSKGIDDNIGKVKASAMNIATQISAVAPNPANLPQGPNPAHTGSNAQSSQTQQQMLTALQGIQRQLLSAPTSSNLGAMTQQYNNNTFNGINDPNSLMQALEKLMGQNFIYGQRGSNFNY